MVSSRPGTSSSAISVRSTVKKVQQKFLRSGASKAPQRFITAIGVSSAKIAKEWPLGSDKHRKKVTKTEPKEERKVIQPKQEIKIIESPRTPSKIKTPSSPTERTPLLPRKPEIEIFRNQVRASSATFDEEANAEAVIFESDDEYVGNPRTDRRNDAKVEIAFVITLVIIIIFLLTLPVTIVFFG